MKRDAFTLIELLVVIAIIAIIAAILFPVFAQAREKARMTACASNEKQLGLAVIQYEQDYDELAPGGANWNGLGTGWAYQVYPYVKSKQVFKCPSEPNNSQMNYCYNQNLVTPQSLGVAPSGLNVSKIIMPTKTVMFCEVTGVQNAANTQIVDPSLAPGASGADWYFHSNGTPDGYSPSGIGRSSNSTNCQDPAGLGSNYGCTPVSTLKYATGLIQGMVTPFSSDYGLLAEMGWHQGGSNYILADGHVKFLQPSTVSGGYPNPTGGDCGYYRSYGGMAANTGCTTLNGVQLAATFSAQ